jgi:hypothetical protein
MPLGARRAARAVVWWRALAPANSINDEITMGAPAGREYFAKPGRVVHAGHEQIDPVRPPRRGWRERAPCEHVRVTLTPAHPS